MKNKGLSFLAVAIFATFLGFVSGNIGNTSTVDAQDVAVTMTAEEAISLQNECEINNISLQFVEDVIETDTNYGIPVDKETIVDELTGFFNKYEDPYAVLMCHHYGESVAKSKTDLFNIYIEDQYVDLFYEIEQRNIK